MPVLFLITFTDILGFGMIIPVLPMFQKVLVLTPLQVGIVVAIFAVCNLIANMIFGILSDKIGRKPLLFIPTILMSICYFITPFFVHSFVALIAMRALTGFFSGNFAVCFAAASDLSSKENRAKAMGLMGSAFGLGFILGPAIGGYLASGYPDNYFTIPFRLAGCLGMVSAILACFLFKESLPLNTTNETIYNIKQQLSTVLKNRVILYNIVFSVLLFVTFSGVEVFFSLWQSIKFGFDPLHIGLFWTVFAIIQTLSQLLVPRFYSGRKALFLGTTLYFIAFLLLSFFTNDKYIALGLVAILVAGSNGLVFPNLSSSISFQGSPHQQGLIFSINQASGSLGRMIGPSLLGAIYTYTSINFAWLFIAFILFIMLFFIKDLFKSSHA